MRRKKKDDQNDVCFDVNAAVVVDNDYDDEAGDGHMMKRKIRRIRRTKRTRKTVMTEKM